MKTNQEKLIALAPALLTAILKSTKVLQDVITPGKDQKSDKDGISELLAIIDSPTMIKSIAEAITQMDFPESSQIKEASYADKTLVVTFKTGATYQYTDVPAHVWGQLIFSQSVGKALNTFVKGKYEFEKLS